MPYRSWKFPLLSSQPCLCAQSGHNGGILPAENHLNKLWVVITHLMDYRFYLQPFENVSTMDLLACPLVQAWSMEALHWCQEGTQELVHHRCKAHVLDLMDILESLKWNFCKFKSRLFALSYHGSTPIQLWYQVNEKQKILNIIQRVIFLPAIISKSIFFPAIISENHKWIQRIEIENQNPVAWFRFLV